MTWSEEDLVHILRKRLFALRHDTTGQDRVEGGFDALCAPELRGQIEQDLTGWANGNPRDLLVICGLTVSAHCARAISSQGDPYQLTREDFTTALRQFVVRKGRPVQLRAVSQSINIRNLIADGESEQVEFKAYLRINQDSGSIDTTMKHKIARSLAAILNNLGGFLLIGVKDDHTVVGIESDLKALGKPTTDGFELALVDIIKQYIGIEHMDCIHITFASLDGQQICVVQMEKSSRPVYVTAGDDHEFWLRAGNSARKLDVKAAIEYIAAHWG